MLFVREVLRANPSEYQELILREFVRYRRLAVRGLHGMGKTTIAAWVVCWSIAVFSEVKVVTTASAYRQLKYYLWPEIRKWALGADWSKVGLRIRRDHELLDMSIKLEGREAFAVVSHDPALIEGAHAPHMVYIFDESKAIPEEVWDAAEGAFSTGDCYWLSISTPGPPVGRFYNIHRRARGYEDWHVRHVTLLDAIKAGRVSAEWAEKRKAQWGEDSAIYKNRVLGDFAESGEDSVIPLTWVEAANERWHERQGKGDAYDKLTYGLDVARHGEDKTTLARLRGRVCEAIEAWVKADTMETTGNVIARVQREIPVAVDITGGLGAGPFDRLRELGHEAIGVNVSETTTMTDSSGELGFVSLRSALWWMMREALDPKGADPLALPPIDELTGDLTAPTWKYTSRGQIYVEPKEETKKRIGRSTDYADALMLALYASIYHSDAWEAILA